LVQKFALEEAPKTTKVQKSHHHAVAPRVPKRISKDDGASMMMMTIVFSTRASRWCYSCFCRRSPTKRLFVLRGMTSSPDLSRLWKNDITCANKKTKKEAQKTTTTHLGILPGDLFVELSLREVPERGADRCAHDF